MRGKGRHDPCVLPRAAPMVEVRRDEMEWNGMVSVCLSDEKRGAVSGEVCMLLLLLSLK